MRRSAPARTSLSWAGWSITSSRHDKIQHEYVKAYTDASFIVREDYHFDDGLFSGYNAAKRSYDKASWMYEMGADGFAKVDPTLNHPRCVFQLLKKHYSRYTPRR